MSGKLQAVSGLRVLDLGLGMAAALTAKFLLDLGLHVDRIEPSGGDPFYGVYPAYEFWRAGQVHANADDLDELIAQADVCLIGGEDFPGLAWRHDADRLRRLNPGLIVVNLAAYVEGGPPGPAVDILVQARTGLVNEQFADRPILFSTLLPTYGAALLAQLGLWSALLARERTGQGQIVRASLQQGVALFWSQIWMEAERADAAFDKLPPKGVSHLIFECADGGHVHFVLGVPGALSKLYRVLGIDVIVDPTERGVPSLERGPRHYFADADILEPAIRKWTRDDFLAALWDAGIPAEPVLLPGEAWSTEQIEAAKLVSEDKEGRRGVSLPLVLEPQGEPLDSGNTGELNAALGPLSGVRVVDLGNFIAGPVASKYLADLGADVIKVEPPGGLANLTGLRNLWACNRGKRSISIDVKTASGAEVVRRLCDSADAVHHNFRFGVAERLNVDPASLRKTQPGLVTLQTRAYGSVGPKRELPGFDMIMQALCGHERRAGGEGNPPLWYRSAFIDYGTGALGAIATVIGLFERRRTGMAVEVEASLLATAMFFMSEVVQGADGAFVGAEILDHKRLGRAATERLYRVRDGWIAVAARTEPMALRFLQVLGLDAGDTAGLSAQWSRALCERIEEQLAALDSDVVLAAFQAADVWAERCVEDGWAALRNDAAARASALVIEVEDETYGAITSCFGPLINFSAWTPDSFRSAPKSGGDADAILASIGLDADAAARLRSEGAII